MTSTTSSFLFALMLFLTGVPGDSAAFSSRESAGASDTPYSRSLDAVEDGRYEEAVPVLLDVVDRNPTNADALNYLGYSYRKLGRYDEARTYYERALAVDPEHRGANEYLGELFLELDQPELAEERLVILDDACGLFGCEEYDELKEKIAEYRRKHGQQ